MKSFPAAPLAIWSARTGAWRWSPGKDRNIHGTLAELAVRSVVAEQTNGSHALATTCSARWAVGPSMPPRIAQTRSE